MNSSSFLTYLTTSPGTKTRPPNWGLLAVLGDDQNWILDDLLKRYFVALFLRLSLDVQKCDRSEPKGLTTKMNFENLAIYIKLVDFPLD